MLSSNTPVEIMIKLNTIDQTARGDHRGESLSQQPPCHRKIVISAPFPPAGVWRGVVIGQVADTLFCQYTDYRGTTGPRLAGVTQPKHGNSAPLSSKYIYCVKCTF